MANPSIRYGASIRKRYAAVKREKQARYKCEICGKTTVKRISTSIWKCRHCSTIYAGGAYTMTTTAGESAKSLVQGLSRK